MGDYAMDDHGQLVDLGDFWQTVDSERDVLRALMERRNWAQAPSHVGFVTTTSWGILSLTL